MNPFINLKKSLPYGLIEEHLVNINHIVRITKAASGSQVFTVEGDFSCDENPAELATMITHLFNQDRRAIANSHPSNVL